MALPAVLLLLAQAATNDPVALLQEGRLPEAETASRADVARKPTDPQSLMILAVILDQEQKYTEAEPYYVRALRVAPTAAPLWNNLGNHYVAKGDLDEARKCFGKLLLLDPLHGNANLQMSLLSLKAGNAADALSYLDKINGRHSPEMAVRSIYARALALKGDYATAESMFSEVVATSPGDFDALYNLGLAALNAGHRDRALEVFNAARKLRPDDPDVVVSLARAQIEAGRIDEPLALLTEVRRRSPNRPDAAALLARVCTMAGFHADAAQAWQDYVKLRPKDDVARRELGFAWVRGGNQANGIPELERFVAAHPDDAIGHFELAVAYTAGDRSKAVGQISRAIALKPDFADALYVRGTLAAEDGKAADAIADLEKARHLQPENPRTLDQLGQAYRALNRKEDARTALKRAAELAPNDGPIVMHYALALRDGGDREEANRYLARFKQLGTDQKRLPPRGLLEWASLSPAEQRKRYFANLRRAVEESPSNTRLRARLGAALLADGQYAEARETLAAAGDDGALDLAAAEYHLAGPDAGISTLDKVAEPRRDGDYWLLRAELLDAKGDQSDAADALNRGLAAAPTRADLFQQSALFLIKHDRPADAAQLLAQATRRLPNEPELALLSAIVTEIAGQEQEAGAALRSIEQRWPEWNRPRLARGIMLAKQSQYAEARKEIELAIALGADSGDAYYYLADIIATTSPDDLNAAAANVKKAIERSPDDAYAHALAARIEAKMGNKEAAIAGYERAAALMPTLPEPHAQLARLYAERGDTEKAARETQAMQKVAAQAGDQTVRPAFVQSLFRVETASNAH